MVTAERAAPDRELRTYGTAELRVAAAAGQPRIGGYAAVFNQLSEDLGGFREQIGPGAFARVLRDDVRALFNHDPSLVLGRTRAGTLRLTEDDHGLGYEVDPPATRAAEDVLELMRRGDVTQSSFAFTVLRDEWQLLPDGTAIRTVLEVERLYDVSVVTYPAYPQTSSAVRSALAALRAPQQAGQAPGDIARRQAPPLALMRHRLDLARRRIL